MMRVAFITVRCGAEVNGGAEAYCLQVAQHMSRHWTTEILTTCAIDYMTWKNDYPPGTEMIGGTTIRRFPVDQERDVIEFNRFSIELACALPNVSHDLGRQWMQTQGPNSTPLQRYIEDHSDEYDAFIFITYSYATTYNLLPLVQDKAWLVSTAHSNEWFLDLPIWNDLFSRPRGLIFLTPEEESHVRSRFPEATPNGRVIGVGINEPPSVDPNAFRRKYHLKQPYILYVGRIDESKGCDSLFEDYLHLPTEGGCRPQLVLIGRAVIPIPDHPDIIHVGFVDEQTKWNAIAGCEWLINPSPYESLSMVLLEAWAAGRPVIITDRCNVMLKQCQRSHGGLWYRNQHELHTILSSTPRSTADILGQQGRQYVNMNYKWKIIEKAYRQEITPE